MSIDERIPATDAAGGDPGAAPDGDASDATVHVAPEPGPGAGSSADEMAGRFEASFALDTSTRYLVKNETPYLITVTRDGFGELVLPPLAERVVKGARLAPFEPQLRLHRQRHEIFVRMYRDEVSPVRRASWYAWLATAALVIVVCVDLVAFGTLLRFEALAAVVVALFTYARVLAAAARHEAARKDEAAKEGSQAGDIAFGIGGSYADGNETARSAERLATLALVLVVGAVLPVIAIIVATDTKDFLVLEGGLRVKAGAESRLVSRVIQLTYTAVLSLFPALLFFQFDRQRAGTIRGQWIRALFRMDGRMRTLADVDATYGDAIYEASSNSADSVRGLGGRHSPIVIATILITLGWTVLVVRTESYDFEGVTIASQHASNASEQAALARDAAANAEEATNAEEANAAAASANAAAETAASAADAAAVVAQSSAAATRSDAPDDSAATAADTADGAAGAEEAAGSSSVGTGDDGDAGNGPPATMAVDDAQASAAAASVQAGLDANAAAREQAQIQTTSFYQLLAPNPSAAGMAFLGAYFFGVYLILRSYFRGDLRSKLYNQITARLTTVVVIAYLMSAVAFRGSDQQKTLWMLAFLAGVVPTTVLDRTFQIVGGLSQKVVGDVFAADRPLEHIDGIDIYDSSKLESEGIPDVASLASGDLASMMVRTRLPIGRLVDWADQAALMVVVGAPGPSLDPRVRELRTHGIRTGTDLLAAIEGNADDVAPGVRQCLSLPSDSEQIGDVDLADMCRAIRRQPVMRQILQWRSSALGDIDRQWIPLPSDVEPIASASYVGPRPGASGAMT